MREIKFRGKSKERDDRWVYGDLATGEYPIFKCWKPPFILDKDGAWEVDPSTVGQYTGLKDKNGKEIYEGDVVRNGYTCTYADGATRDFYVNGTVVMDVPNGCYAINNSEHDALKRLTVKMVKQHSIEIVGNVLEVSK